MILIKTWQTYSIMRNHWLQSCPFRGGSSHFKRGLWNPRQSGGANHMSPCKCIDCPKKGGFQPPEPPTPWICHCFFCSTEIYHCRSADEFEKLQQTQFKYCWKLIYEQLQTLRLGKKPSLRISFQIMSKASNAW